MRNARGIALLGVTCLFAVAPATAQRRARGVYADVGSLTTIADLNNSGTASLKGGLFVGGGLWWQPIATDSSLTVQGDFVWNREQLHTANAGSGTNVDLFLYSLNLDYIFWAHRRVALTLAGGGGAAVLHVWDTTGTVRARPFARFGLGARYTAKRRLQLFVQTFGIVYELRNFPSTSVLGAYSHRQSAVAISLGAALGL
jgi:Outer membrane protein beta-barrel domain